MVIVWDDGTAGGVPVTAQNKKVYPGHQLKLKAFLINAPGASIADYEWTIPPETFASYKLGPEKTDPATPVTVKDGESVNFFFSEKGDGKIVSAKITTSARNVYAGSVTFDVELPTVTYHEVDAGTTNPKFGRVINCAPGGGFPVTAVEKFVTLINADTPPPEDTPLTSGILFGAELGPFPGFTEDSQWAFAQTGSGKIRRNWDQAKVVGGVTLFAVVGQSTETVAGEIGGDGVGFEEGMMKVLLAHVGASGMPPWKTDGETIGSNHDGPGGTKMGKNWSLCSFDMAFTTYVILLPDPNDTPVKLPSAWVPVFQTEWKVDFCASRPERTNDDFTVEYDDSQLVAGWGEFSGSLPSYPVNLEVLNDRWKDDAAKHSCAG